MKKSILEKEKATISEYKWWGKKEKGSFLKNLKNFSKRKRRKQRNLGIHSEVQVSGQIKLEFTTTQNLEQERLLTRSPSPTNSNYNIPAPCCCLDGGNKDFIIIVKISCFLEGPECYIQWLSYIHNIHEAKFHQWLILINRLFSEDGSEFSDFRVAFQWWSPEANLFPGAQNGIKY